MTDLEMLKSFLINIKANYKIVNYNRYNDEDKEGNTLLFKNLVKIEIMDSTSELYNVYSIDPRYYSVYSFDENGSFISLNHYDL